MKPDIFKYIDYRVWLEELYTFLKDEKRRFSYRQFSLLTGSNTPNYLQTVLNRKLSLGNKNIVAIGRSFNLSKKEEEYLELLVAFDKSSTHEEKEKYYRKIIRLRAQKSKGPIDVQQYEYFNNWYHAVIRELVVHPEYQGNNKWIAERLNPSVSLQKITSSLKLLQKLNLIVYDVNKKQWTQTDTHISTPSTVPNIAIRRYHKEMINLAETSLDTIKGSNGTYRSITVGLNDKGLKKLQAKCEDFWHELQTLCEEFSETEDVYQVNIQCFPLTKKRRSKDG